MMLFSVFRFHIVTQKAQVQYQRANLVEASYFNQFSAYSVNFTTSLPLMVYSKQD
jgi:hypothetical protein